MKKICIILLLTILLKNSYGWFSPESQLKPNVTLFATDSAGQTIVSNIPMVGTFFSTNSGLTYNHTQFQNIDVKDVVYLSKSGDTVLVTQRN